ncbi:Xanthine-guanine phosphoribosyltransferase [Buchnera aphidicola (Periphyllus testudinaceus)]|uniref:xanthine phosphoribosyltransferase n=1 Tax=Buchnera aphidicola TaxID=9 RepID=UPI0034647CFA
MKKKYIVTWDMLQIHSKNLALKVNFKKKWKGIFAISRGGLVPCAILSRELGIRYVDTICISSYDNMFLRKLKIIKKVNNTGKNILIVDDLVDTGRTIKIVRKMYPKAYFVTIFAKPLGCNLVDDYMVNIPQDTWIEQPWDMFFSYNPPIVSDF